MAARPRGKDRCPVWPLSGALALRMSPAIPPQRSPLNAVVGFLVDGPGDPSADESHSAQRLSRRGGYPGGERCGRRYVFLDCVCHAPRARCGGERPPANEFEFAA
jgi:hypothetical protein